MPPIRKIGKMVIAITMIPVPPSHWRRERHKRMPLETLSKWLKTVDPVVVRAETDSNQELRKPKDKDDQKKGSPAKKEVAIQLPAVNKKASLTPSFLFSSDRLDKTNKVPTRPVTKAEMANPCHPFVL